MSFSRYSTTANFPRDGCFRSNFDDPVFTPARTKVTQVDVTGNSSCLLIGEERQNFTTAKFICESEFINGILMRNSTFNVKLIKNFWVQKKRFPGNLWVDENSSCITLNHTTDTEVTSCQPLYLEENYVCEYPPLAFCGSQTKMFPEIDSTCYASFMTTWQWNDFNHSERCNETFREKPTGIIRIQLGSDLCNCPGIQWSKWKEWTPCEPCGENGTQKRYLDVSQNCGRTSNDTLPHEERSCKIQCPKTTTTTTTTTMRIRKKAIKLVHYVLIGFIVLSLVILLFGLGCLLIGRKKKHYGPLGLMSVKNKTSFNETIK